MANLFDVLEGAGNFLDLPGSSVRDLLSGRDPRDQWSTPFQGKNRASGRDVLAPWIGENEETGMSGWLDNPMEGVKDMVGFGAEMLTDPLNLIPAGWLGWLLRGNKAGRAVEAAAVAERGGKYGFVNPKIAAGVEDAAVAARPDSPMKRLGYAPPREEFQHGGHRWDAEPGYPYGRFDLSRMKTGEGNAAKGPGAYIADLEKTSVRYKDLTSDTSRPPVTPEMLEKYFSPGSIVPSWGGWDRVIQYDPSSGVVTAQAVKKAKSTDLRHSFATWVDDGPVREHSTAPHPRDVYRLLKLPLPEGVLYKLDAPAGTRAKLLDWENPLHQQPEAVHDAVDSALPGYHASRGDFQRADAAYKRLKEQANEYITGYSQKRPDMERAHAIRNQRDTILRDFEDSSGLLTNEHIEQGAALGAAYQQSAATYQSGVAERILRGKAKGEEVMRSVFGGENPWDADLSHVEPFIDAGVPGSSHLDGWSRSAGVGTQNHVIWDQNLLDQMRVRAINGEQVPINPTTLVHKVPQVRQAAESALTSSMNPITRHVDSSLLAPKVYGAAYNAIVRFQTNGGVQ
jgi:hypothetical protein